jgi:epsilon-lactone hydrolase
VAQTAGAILTGQVSARLKHDQIPLPRALGFFTGHADFTKTADSHAFFAVPGLADAKIPEAQYLRPYMNGRDPNDPLASPILGDLKGLPPTLCMTGTRDQYLSATSNFHRALLRAGVEADLVVFDAMAHAHWYMIGIPEATEALEIQAKWFDRRLNGK